MKRLLPPLAALAVAATALAINIAHSSDERETQSRPTVTERYLADLDLDQVRTLGRSPAHPRYSPLRIGAPLPPIDRTYDYDFDGLARTFRSLEGVDRRTALREIFARITKGAAMPTEQHLAILRFVQDASFHSYWLQPVHRNGTAVFDPLVLLALNEMRCGQTSRLAVDLFRAAGFAVRVAQLGGHVAAEVYYDGDWHFFEADVLEGGVTVRAPDGSIPSLAELAGMRAQLDRLPHYLALSTQPGWLARRQSPPYPSSYYFSRRAYTAAPLYYVKTATPRQERASPLYGWDRYRTVRDRALLLTNEPLRFQPGPPRWRSARVERGRAGAPTLVLSWSAAPDGDGDLLGYRVHVASRTRGWGAPEFSGAPAARRFWSRPGPWTEASFEALLRPPPTDVALIRTRSRTLRLPLAPGRRYFVSVTGIDRYGERIGKRVFFVSDELRVDT